jgi:hypothetical protein
MVHYAAVDQIVADIDRLTQRQYAEGDGGDIADGVTPLESKIHATAG